MEGSNAKRSKRSAFCSLSSALSLGGPLRRRFFAAGCVGALAAIGADLPPREEVEVVAVGLRERVVARALAAAFLVARASVDGVARLFRSTPVRDRLRAG